MVCPVFQPLKNLPYLTMCPNQMALMFFSPDGHAPAGLTDRIKPTYTWEFIHPWDVQPKGSCTDLSNCLILIKEHEQFIFFCNVIILTTNLLLCHSMELKAMLLIKSSSTYDWRRDMPHISLQTYINLLVNECPPPARSLAWWKESSEIGTSASGTL